jgi:3-hydroxybutyryl-CoA dehydrogenase
MTIKEVSTVCSIGAGTMGCYNALVAAVSGYEVVIYDVSEQSLAKVPENHAEIGAHLVGVEYCTGEELAASMARIRTTTDLASAVADADLVTESVFEDLNIKREVHGELDRLCPPKSILTTNTSGLLVSDIEDVVERGDRFAALHSHLGSPLIDIVGGPRTSAQTIDVLTRYVKSLKCAPLVLHKENRGYVLNALLGSVLTTALVLVVQGVASKREVDSAWMQHRRAPMGPFGMMDLFGLNVVYDGWQHREPDPATDALKPGILSGLQPYIDRGELGRKAGKGFYDYPNPAFEQEDFVVDNERVAIASASMTAALLGNSVLLAANDVADPGEIDYAWTVGMTLDTGPFAIIDGLGVETTRQLLQGPAAAYSDEDIALIMQYLAKLEDRKHDDG